MATLARLASVDVGEVQGLKGARGKKLAEAGIATVADLLLHAPRRYIDRSRVEPIATLPLGEEITVIGTVRSVSIRRPRRNLIIVEARVTDGTDVLEAVWFNQGYRAKQLAEGAEVALSGVVESFRNKRQMKSPDLDVLSGATESLTTGRVVPVHPNVKSVGIGWIRRGIHNALQRSRPVPDPVPEAVRDRLDLVDRDTALSDLHFPASIDRVNPARRRLAFDELFRLSLALASRRAERERSAQGISHRPTGALSDVFRAGLPYTLTGDQERGIEEILDDLRNRLPMNRLLQGEVGSGKTVVAVLALLAGIEGGFQGAVMAPTEVLATQHYLGIRDLLAGAGLSPEPEGEGAELGMGSLFGGHDGPVVRMALLTGSQQLANWRSDVKRKDLLAEIAAGNVDIVVGTHALIQEGVSFQALGIAIVDEQHRFGAMQRQDLKAKGRGPEPDLLIMTATPIPRTLSMTLYGDLEVSSIEELPPGRIPVRTVALGRGDEQGAWDVIRSEVGRGRQAYVVCPLVEDSDKIEAASATGEFERLRGVFPDLSLGLLHGQLASKEKESVMEAFRRGELDVLVATTVIEVGIDVANATVIVIEDADRFGLSQLHQLRGRVGRGHEPGTCILLADPTTPDGEQRIEAMVASTDGFRLAEIDLAIRGQGTVFGDRQSGLGDLRMADIVRDFELLVEARREAFAIVEADPTLSRMPGLRDELTAMLGDEVAWLFVS
ncbi:MAG TPA: ATP-dependent DNA helicase RecG [Acidimicrobiia bacterium]|nr:ATP-dependent DNA helicase RecG [Acidimicrobiia bacterium]